MYGKRAIPKTLSAAFPGLSIRNGILSTPKDTLFSPPAYLIFEILNQLTPSIAITGEDNLVPIIVDTRPGDTVKSSSRHILLQKNNVQFNINDSLKIPVTYPSFLFGDRDFTFTQKGILSHLQRHVIKILFSYFVLALMMDSSMFLFSIFFLAIAAFIFRIDRNRKFKEYLKTAVFAISPLVLGGILISLSGVKILWVWHILILLSTVVMFRAIIALSNDTTSAGDKT